MSLPSKQVYNHRLALLVYMIFFKRDDFFFVCEESEKGLWGKNDVLEDAREIVHIQEYATK